MAWAWGLGAQGAGSAYGAQKGSLVLLAEGGRPSSFDVAPRCAALRCAVQDVLRGAADEVLAALKNEKLKVGRGGAGKHVDVFSRRRRAVITGLDRLPLKSVREGLQGSPRHVRQGAAGGSGVQRALGQASRSPSSGAAWSRPDLLKGSKQPRARQRGFLC